MKRSVSSVSLDEFDRAILRILQVNNRTLQRTIGEQVHLSAAAVQRRIARMGASGIIAANVAIVAADAFMPSIKIVVEVHLKSDGSAMVEATKSLFRTIPEIQHCYYVTGNGGFILIMIVQDMPRYEKLARALFADNATVDTYRTLVVLDSVKTSTMVDIPELD
ncbi:Lrp/AsnC family transcriptional regulator [Komagataeibacter sp. FNDCF1]|uniref:Lrp/AsnC family transcriptional regulator n=1 Tax=Komagataeibacter sp. FNDCF1 TaxID=2878681 RepID=UPI001E3DD9C5|nr:Lrp/AsnC family transcriptional regulator [Komagataeibacter sp. FNDCF1]MCE2563597.1 Lrp/AsnC family transcriptional regulator [Komagataeibacter sp. FNDCF1]